MIEIIPSLLVRSHDEFEQKLRAVEKETETIHVDILDGSLFHNTSWFNAEAVGAMRTSVRYELHLMVENPLPIIADWKAHVATTHRAIVHAEIDRQLGAILEQVQQVHGLETGVALNPETPLEEIHHLLHTLDSLLLMGVHPGTSGQAFLGNMILEKIRSARAHAPALPIEIDGGVREHLIDSLVRAGATRICAASEIFSAPKPEQALRTLKKQASTNR